MTFHLQMVIRARPGGLVPWLWQSVASPLEDSNASWFLDWTCLLLRKNECVYKAHLVTNPVKSCCCLFYCESESINSSQLSSVLLTACLGGQRRETLGPRGLGWNLHFPYADLWVCVCQLCLSLLSSILFLKVLSFVQPADPGYTPTGPSRSI